MKLNTAKYISSICMLLTVALAGCLKDKDFDNHSIQSVSPGGNQNIVELKVSANDATKFVSFAFDNVDKDTTINLIPVNLATSGPAPEDIKVTLKLDTTVVNTYNDSIGTEYEIPDPSLYTVVNAGNVVTIPKGSHTGYLQIKLNPRKIIGGNYAFGYVIQSIDKPKYIVSGNFKDAVANVITKNKYDGRYKISGTLVDVLAPGNSSVPGDPYPYEVELVTTGASSVKMHVKGVGDFHLIAGSSVYGEFDPEFVFDPATNKITVVRNALPSPARNRAAAIDPTGLNQYNADKSIDVKYTMTQGGALKATFDEHLEYLGVR